MASRPPQQTSAPRPRNRPSNSAPRLQTTNMNDQSRARYSYQETPVEMQRPVFHPFSSPTNSVIDESPISAATASRSPPGYEQASPTPLPAEKALEANIQAPPREMHPAYSAPVAEPTAPVQQPPQNPRPQSTTAPPPNPPLSPGPLPTKPPESKPPPTSNTAPLPKPGIDRADTYNPHSLQGPNVSPENHRPGQVSHPNANRDPHWKHGLCEPDTLCCMGIFCPCMVYGRTTYRLSRRAEKKDATDMLGYESCNGSCTLFAVACGFQWLLAAVHRTRIRKLYKIEGSFGSDCVKGLCLCCCMVAQNEREVKEREESLRQHAGPVAGAYVAPNGGMTYAPPPR